MADVHSTRRLSGGRLTDELLSNNSVQDTASEKLWRQSPEQPEDSKDKAKMQSKSHSDSGFAILSSDEDDAVSDRSSPDAGYTDEDGVVAGQPSDGDTAPAWATPGARPTLLSRLEWIRALSDRIHAAGVRIHSPETETLSREPQADEEDEDETQGLTQNEHESSADNQASLMDPTASSAHAVLLCQRAKSLLEHADFDAEARIPRGVVQPRSVTLSGSSAEEEMFRLGRGLPTVRLALRDAREALRLVPGSEMASVLAAQCARSLGRPRQALAFLERVVAAAPPQQDNDLFPPVEQLMRELRVDLTRARGVTLAPSPLVPTQLVRQEADDEVSSASHRPHGADDGPQRGHHGGSPVPVKQQQYPANDTDAGASTEPEPRQLVAADVDAQCRRVAALAATSAALTRLEHMQHHNKLHACATAEDVKALQLVTEEATRLLSTLLLDATTTSHALAGTFKPATLSSMAWRIADAAPHLATDSSARRWVVTVLAPAVVVARQRHAQVENEDEGEDTDARVHHHRVCVLHDALLLQSRVLRAWGQLAQCTCRPHALSSIRAAYELAKHLASPPETPSADYRRWEMVCADSYAWALLELANEPTEAWLLHHESLHCAVQQEDHARELRCRHLLGRALLRSAEYDTAHLEFLQLLQLSQRRGDRAMEALAWFSLGECAIARGNGGDHEVRRGIAHLVRAQRLCRETSCCHHEWRRGAVEDAISFYSQMCTTRRAAMTSSTVSMSMGMATKATEWQHDEDERRTRTAAASVVRPVTEAEDVVHAGAVMDRSRLREVHHLPPSRRGGIWVDLEEGIAVGLAPGTTLPLQEADYQRITADAEVTEEVKEKPSTKAAMVWAQPPSKLVPKDDDTEMDTLPGLVKARRPSFWRSSVYTNTSVSSRLTIPRPHTSHSAA